MRPRKILQGIAFVAFFFFLCQGWRLIVTTWLKESSFTCNAWGAFSVPFSPLVLFFLAFIAFFFFLSGWYQSKIFSEEWPWLLLIAGGVSNFYERVVHNCVTDYIFLGWFPVFNGADVLLSVGAIILVWQILIREWLFNIRKV